MPINALHSHLQQDLKGASLGLSGVNDDGQIGVHGDANEAPEDRFLALPELFRHPVVVQADLTNGERFADVFTNPSDGVFC